jgi:DNA-binding NtrC family response regulator
MVTGAPPKPGSTGVLSGDDTPIAAGATVLYVPGASRDRAAVRDRLIRSGAQTTVASTVTEALQQIGSRKFALCLFDLSDDRAALAAIRVVRARQPQLPIAVIVDPAKAEAAGEAINAGITDLLTWPFEDRDLSALVANILERGPSDLNGTRRSGEDLFAQSPAMRLVMELVRGSAEVRGGVCICGEPGTGRQLVARAIHGRRPPESDRPFVVVDCAGEEPQELERRLFGVVGDSRPAGTEKSALERIGRTGAIALAAGGTLFLKNPVEAPARVQAKLARLLRDGEAWSVEQKTNVELNVRPIAAVDASVDAAVEEGRLRGDLYERLAQVRIDMPPLRRRREDVPLLAVHILKQTCDAHGVSPRSFSRSALALLTALPWHGNARELRSLIEGLVRSLDRPVIHLDDLLDQASLDGMPARIDTGVSLREARARFERDCISAVLMRHHGRVGEAAKALGIQRTNLYRKVRQLNVARSLLSSRK